VDLATGAEHLRAELDGLLAAAVGFQDPISEAVAYLAPVFLLALNRNGNHMEAALLGLCGIFGPFSGVFFFNGIVSGASQAADVRMILRRSSAEADAQLEFPPREYDVAVDVDGVVTEQVTVDPVSDLWREIEEAKATLALRPAEVLISPIQKRARATMLECLR
jgi:hypothetical protein